VPPSIDPRSVETACYRWVSPRADPEPFLGPLQHLDLGVLTQFLEELGTQLLFLVLQ